MKERFKVADVEGVLRRTAGLVGPAAEILANAYGSCTPATVRNYIARHPRLAEAIRETVERNLDMAESKLIGAINLGNLTAIIFYLKTKGKDRGYVERQEQSGPDGAPLQQQATLVILPDNGRDALRQQ
jgi:hypothetical protein